MFSAISPKTGLSINMDIRALVASRFLSIKSSSSSSTCSVVSDWVLPNSALSLNWDSIFRVYALALIYPNPYCLYGICLLEQPSIQDNRIDCPIQGNTKHY
jgi:hypothetical protein